MGEGLALSGKQITFGAFSWSTPLRMEQRRFAPLVGGMELRLQRPTSIMKKILKDIVPVPEEHIKAFLAPIHRHLDLTD